MYKKLSVWDIWIRRWSSRFLIWFFLKFQFVWFLFLRQFFKRRIKWGIWNFYFWFKIKNANLFSFQYESSEFKVEEPYSSFDSTSDSDSLDSSFSDDSSPSDWVSSILSKDTVRIKKSLFIHSFQSESSEFEVEEPDSSFDSSSDSDSLDSSSSENSSKKESNEESETSTSDSRSKI